MRENSAENMPMGTMGTMGTVLTSNLEKEVHRSSPFPSPDPAHDRFFSGGETNSSSPSSPRPQPQESCGASGDDPRAATVPTIVPVVVVASRYVAGGAFTVEASTVSLADALTRAWPSDAHLQACHAPRWRRRRLTGADVGRTPIAMQAFVVDLDAPGHAPTPAWRAEIRSRVEKAFATWGPGFFCTTKGGARVMWRLRDPFPIATPADAAAWRRRYLAACAALEADFDIVADRACADWTRLFRLPLVVRDGVATRPEVMGDPDKIAAVALPEAPPIQSSPPPARRVRPGPAGKTGDVPLLERLLRARGDVVGEHTLDTGEIVPVVRCPNALRHARGHGDSGDHALLFPPAGAGVGWIHCARSACAEVKDWIPFFSPDEIAAAGIATRRARIEKVTLDQPRPREWSLVATLRPADDGGKLPAYLRVASTQAARWDALFAACDLATPDPKDEKDTRSQCRWLAGEVIALEIDATVGRRTSIRRLLPATKETTT